MGKNRSVSVILPCYNEGRRIIPIIDEIKKSPFVDEIIVVDDGSNEETKNILKNIKDIYLITHPKNFGKSQAMKTGLLKAKSEIISFVDCDLINFTYKHLNLLLEPILNRKYDLVLSDRENELLIFRLLGISIALTGERAISKELLIKNLDIFNAPGYLIETSMNKIFFRKNIRITKVLFKDVGQYYKFRKNRIEGIKQDFNFFKNWFKYFGLKELLYQTNFVKNLKYFNSRP